MTVLNGGIFSRAFDIDAGGEMLAVANQELGKIWIAGRAQRVVPNLVSFKIGDDRLLTFGQQHNYPNTEDVCFWTTILTMRLGNKRAS